MCWKCDPRPVALTTRIWHIDVKDRPTGDVFAELLDSWNIEPRLGAVGKHGSISVTERVIKTLKYKWLKRVSLIRGFDHLVMLCEEFEDWYNTWRPHMTLDGFRPNDVYYDRKPKIPQRDSKTIPSNIQQHLFRETRVTGYRLKDVAQSLYCVTPLLLPRRRRSLAISINR